MERPVLEVADLVRAAGERFIETSRGWLSGQHLKVLSAIERCRTAALKFVPAFSFFDDGLNTHAVLGRVRLQPFMESPGEF